MLHVDISIDHILESVYQRPVKIIQNNKNKTGKKYNSGGTITGSERREGSDAVVRAWCAAEDRPP